jgi:hypothetical protein
MTGGVSGTSGSSGAAGGGGSPTGGAAATGGTGGTEPPLDCSQPKAATVPLRLLTASQYDHSVLDIFGISGEPSAGFGGGLDDIALEQRANVAAAVATEAAANLAWAPCRPPASGSATACEQQIIDTIGAKLYRHPLSEGERAELKKLFDAGIAEKDFATGVEWFLTAILQAPDFMYEVARPQPSETPGTVLPLAPHEYASRLAYFIWDGPPDDALATAAAAGTLDDPAGRDAQVSRMLSDAKFSRGLEEFYRGWLSLKGFAEIARDESEFDQEVITALSTSLLMSATELYKAPNPNITSLFSGDTYYLNDVLRGFYGVSGTGTAFTAVSMPGENRRGILTHPGMMALLARPNESFPIGRGLHLLRTILCQVISAPPPDLEIPPQPPLQSGVSTRQRLEMHTASEICQGCHAMINPAGFSFESFDEVGRFRATDHAVAVDSSGTLDLGLADIDGTFATGDELLQKLGQSPTVRACFAEKYLDFAVARPSQQADACSLRTLRESFGASGDLKQLIVSVAASDSFRMRLAEGVGK